MVGVKWFPEWCDQYIFHLFVNYKNNKALALGETFKLKRTQQWNTSVLNNFQAEMHNLLFLINFVESACHEWADRAFSKD